MRLDIPVIHIESWREASPTGRAAIAETVDSACRTSGFLVIEAHGVPRTVIDAAWAAAGDFFDLPLDEKMRLAPEDPIGPRGYFPMQRETLSLSRGVTGPADPKESFSCGPLATPTRGSASDLEFFYGSNAWPRRPVGFRTAWEAYYAEMERLAADIMSLFAGALRLDERFFEPFLDQHVSALRGLRYATVAAGRSVTLAGAHSDYGSLTILKPDPVVPGLELETAPGQWQAAPPTRDGFIVNIGDLMQRWTNDRWTSTVHRVTGSAGARHAGRQSIAFFQNPNFDAVIECLPGCHDDARPPAYAPVIAGDYLRDRFTAAVPQP